VTSADDSASPERGIERARREEYDMRAFAVRNFGMARTHGAYADYTAVAPGVKTEPLAPSPTA